MSASHSILLLELEELKANMNTMQAEMNRCVARVEKVISSVRNVKSSEVNESVNESEVKDKIVESVGCRYNTSSDDTNCKDDSLEHVNDNLDCFSSRPFLVRNGNKRNRSKRDIPKDSMIYDINSNTVADATNKVSIPTKIVEASLAVDHWDSGTIVGYGGLVINTIRRETGVNVSVKVPKGRGSVMGLVEMKGKQADVEHATEIIKTILAPPVSNHSSDWEPSDQLIAGGGLIPPTKIVKKTLTVPGQDAGTIIGERGANIKMIWREACANILIHEMEGSRRLVEIMGEESCVERALDLIKKKVMEENEKM